MTEQPPEPTPLTRAKVSAVLWGIAEQHITAEWICCEPIKPTHSLCWKGNAALGMAKTLLVDSDPDATWNPAAPVLDAVMGMISGTDNETLIDELNAANIELARQLAERNAQLGRYLTQLHQEPGHTEGHIYLSTGCIHDNHDYCKSMTGIQGSKRPGRCKVCDAQCICTCHTETHVVTDDSDDPEHVEDCPGCENFTLTGHVTAPKLQELRCNHARTHWDHVPHDWEPQPGMDEVHCPGHPEDGCGEWHCRTGRKETTP